MVTIIVTYKCRPGMRGAFLEALKSEELGKKCEQEQGNIRYAYACADADEDVLYLLEQWESAEALKAHFAQPHFARIGQVKDEFVLDTVLEKYGDPEAL